MEERFKNYKKLIYPDGKFNERFSVFYELLKEYNERYNLTTVLEEKDVLYKHFLDSAAGEFLFPPRSKVLEVGSGAGFPSMVLKMMRDDLSFTLVESVGKKCEFLKVASRRLQMKDVTVLNGRAEDFARDPAYREKFDVVCARAVARMNTLCEYCIPFVKKGGIFIAYKSGDEEEFSECKKAVSVLGGKIKENYLYELPENYGKRSLIVVEKVNYTLPKYPRGNGKERKNPIL